MRGQGCYRGVGFLLVLMLALTLGGAPVWAAGPAVVARADRSLWPQALDSQAAFDRASRAEALVFVAALAEATAADATTLKTRLHVTSVDAASLERTRQRLLAELLRGWQSAAQACHGDEPFCPAVASVPELLAAGAALESTLPAAYRAWFRNAQVFHQHYADELVRLAVLSPRVSSEIALYSTQERNGFELPDRQFLLSFDDGPSPRGGHTDALLQALKASGVHGAFFVLGEALQARLGQEASADLATDYAGQCLALHGWRHLSHAQWPQWQESVTRTRDLVHQTFPAIYRPWFRPPYGQRRADSGAFFQQQGLGVVLWNIDSQDWNAHVSADDAAQRVLTLMLLWRHGIILFHDIHPKAAQAVPWLLKQTQGTGVQWLDCQHYAASVSGPPAPGAR